MHVTFRFPHLAGVLLLLAGPWASAQSSLPDPIAPAVIGRPLDQIRPVHRKPAAARPAARRQVATANHRVQPSAPAAAVAVAPAPVQPQPAPQMAAAAQATRIAGNAPARSGSFSSQDHALVRSYYASHPLPAQAAQWKRGEPIPPKAQLSGVPDDLRHALTPLPPGHQYVEVDGDVVLVAVQSRLVVDGISRGMR